MTLGNPFLIGRREEQRLERRRAVAEAARRWFTEPDIFVATDILLAALHAPKPWTTGHQRLQPSRPTRARRKHCTRLLRRQLEEARG